MTKANVYALAQEVKGAPGLKKRARFDAHWCKVNVYVECI